MATVSLELSNPRSDGKRTVRLRVTHNRKHKRISTHIYVSQKDVGKRGNIVNVVISSQVNKLVDEARLFCNALGFSVERMTVEELTERIKRHLKGDDRFRLDFIAYLNEQGASKIESTRKNYEYTAKAIARYVGADSFDILDITPEWITRFLNHEISRVQKDGRKGTGVLLNFKMMKSVYQTARDTFNRPDISYNPLPYNPFDKIKTPRIATPQKRAISVQEIQRLIDCSPSFKGMKRARDMFLLSFCLCGMNLADLYFAGKPNGEYLTYQRTKTKNRRTDGAEMTIRIEPEASIILERYADELRLTNLHTLYPSHRACTSALSISIAKLFPTLNIDGTFYSARHSWATIASSREVGIDKYTVHEALNHAVPEMSITEVYIARDWSKVWEANRKVLDLFDWSNL